jgi:hypothetical protein
MLGNYFKDRRGGAESDKVILRIIISFSARGIGEDSVEKI